jgi:phospholipid/cholesterol/gamma-HCH transport system permease protein
MAQIFYSSFITSLAMPTTTTLNRNLAVIGDQYYFIRSVCRNLFRPGFEGSEFIRQSYTIGFKSAWLCILTGFILGVVLTIQSQPTLKDFGAESFIPRMVTISVIREIGPVIVALICAGKISSSIGAELGSMKVTEQIDAMAVSGANPLQFLVVPRILACTLMIPLLTILADATALAGGFLATDASGGMTMQLYFNKAISGLQFSDIYPALIKSVLFGFAIGYTGCWNGFNADHGTESVGIAANRAVVTASVAVIMMDAFVVQLTNWIIYN